jgi:K+-sensing histidine kinase KdpD
VYFIALVSNSIRYGMGMAVYVALLFNIAYVVVLMVHAAGGDLTREGVKILAFWAVALYAGYLATRFRRQARILQAYEETIAELRARLEARAHSGPPAAPP